MSFTEQHAAYVLLFSMQSAGPSTHVISRWEAGGPKYLKGHVVYRMNDEIKAFQTFHKNEKIDEQPGFHAVQSASDVPKVYQSRKWSNIVNGVSSNVRTLRRLLSHSACDLSRIQLSDRIPSAHEPCELCKCFQCGMHTKILNS